MEIHFSSPHDYEENKIDSLQIWSWIFFGVDPLIERRFGFFSVEFFIGPWPTHRPPQPIGTFVNVMRKAPWILMVTRWEEVLLHRILEIEPNCRDEAVIRKAYLEKAKQYHPDSTFQDSQADRAKFNQVQQAYEALTVNSVAVRAIVSIFSFRKLWNFKDRSKRRPPRHRPTTTMKSERNSIFDTPRLSIEPISNTEDTGQCTVRVLQRSTRSSNLFQRGNAEPTASCFLQDASGKGLRTCLWISKWSWIDWNARRIDRTKETTRYQIDVNDPPSSLDPTFCLDRLETSLIVWWKIWFKNRCPKAISTTFDRVENRCTNEIRTTWISPPTKSMRFWSTMVNSMFERNQIHFVCAQVTCPTGFCWRKKSDNQSNKRESIWNVFSKRLPRNIRRRQRSMNIRRIWRIIRNGFKRSKNSKVILRRWMWTSTSWIWSFQCCGDNRWRVVFRSREREKCDRTIFSRCTTTRRKKSARSLFSIRWRSNYRPVKKN